MQTAKVKGRLKDKKLCTFLGADKAKQISSP